VSWSSNLAAVDAAVAGYFDETLVTAVAMKKPAREVNAQPVPDESRASFAFMATIEIDPQMDAIGMTMRPTSSSDGNRHTAKICLTALATIFPWMPRQGDRLVVGDVTYSIASAPDRDGTDRVVIWLNKAR
jgi:hypothetical protein